MNRVQDCENMCQRPQGFICTSTCRIAEDRESDDLLWSAMMALSHTIRELGRFEQAGNYGDAIVVLNKIEAHFGVGAQAKNNIWDGPNAPDFSKVVWCNGCDNHVRQDDPCYIKCGGKE